ncbi:MAG: transposase family protein [Halothece sp.]
MNSEKSLNTLVEYLKQIPEFRDPRGCRHPLWLVLLLIIMGIMSGYYGYRGIGRFVERHRRALSQVLEIRGAQVPSYSTIRRVMMGVD